MPATSPPVLTPEELQSLLGLTDDQLRAVVETDTDVIVTAGAGTGKTQTLVARYLWHLSQGLTPRQVAAVTFTDKAAREMRNRIRAWVGELARRSSAGAGETWTELEAQMDSARIGTIHSLCAEILRAHPVEADIDPGFEVLEEGWATALKSQAVEDALAWGVTDKEVAAVFGVIRPLTLGHLLTALLNRRLETAEMIEPAGAPDGRTELALATLLERFLADPHVADARAVLKKLMDNPGDDKPTAGMADQVQDLLHGLTEAEVSLEDSRAFQAAARLFGVRRHSMRLNLGRKGGRALEAVRQVRQAYDDLLDPWLKGSGNSDAPPDLSLEARYDRDLDRLATLFRRAQSNYRLALESRRSLDFDDLEDGARRLLEIDDIRRHWRASIERVLVDEYQDTNPRQQAILDALTGEGKGALFVVGDSRQSIYRFRGADVTVFRRLMLRRARTGERTFELSATFRSHARLLDGLDEILGQVMGTEESERLFQVPYTRLKAVRQDGAGNPPPYLEIVAGLGESAGEARRLSAQALTGRLLELQQAGEVQSWDQVALLFRASSGFEEYERSLEASGIPFVTVAGRGFYDRPEIRDVLNCLSVLADPTDDLAMAGFLRSPAIGLTDLGLMQLRGLPGEHGSLWLRLADGAAGWSAADRQAGDKARAVLAALLPEVDRLPVAELIKRMLDELNLRAALAASHSRLWRNVDKLVDDAQASRVVRLSEFLDYLRTLRAVGAREGEAPAEAEGAVRLMTIHKAKGLEFDVTVLADASRRPYAGSAWVYLSPTVGLAFRPDRAEGVPLAFRVAQQEEALQAEAESLRLLYVALTRAREKLIVSGHISQARGSWNVDGWFGQVLETLGLSGETLAAESGAGGSLTSPQGLPIKITVADGSVQVQSAPTVRTAWPASSEKDLYHPLGVVQIEATDAALDEPQELKGRASGEAAAVRGQAVGRMVHVALERGWTPAQDDFPSQMMAEARRAGLTSGDQLRAALEESQRLLERLFSDPIWNVMQSGKPRLAEVPFTTPASGGVSRSGRIDLLFGSDDGWTVVDFKTETIHGEDQLAEVAQAYFEAQLGPYVDAVETLLGERPLGRLCFLDVDGQVRLVDLPRV